MTGRADTIFAVATGPVRAGIAIVRLSGSEAMPIAATLAGGLPADRRAGLRRLRDRTGETLDHAVVLTFAGPHSYTGEDCVELHLHGGRAVVEGVLRALLLAGGRSAEPGEFTRRAHLGGRIDLIEAEGIADLIAADTDAQRRQALALAEGGFSAVARGWSDRLTRLLAMAEARIDFPDETGDAEVDGDEAGETAALRVELDAHLEDADAGRRVRDGIRIALVGAPNVGKSSLLNRLVARDVSIVTAHPGTTRDLVEADLVLADIPARLVDTAGIRDTADDIEREGIRRASRAAAEADLVVRIDVPGACPSWPDPSGGPVLDVTNKTDLGPAHPGTIPVCAATGAGIDTLRAALARSVGELTARRGSAVMCNARQRDCVREAAGRLGRAAEARVSELRAEELRLARASLGRLTGVAGTEALLDTIFSSFCIGK